MFWFNILMLLLSAYMAKEDYERGRIGWAMAWSYLVGWNLHSLLGVL